MKGSILLELATTFAVISLVAIGGANATIPEIHRQIVEQLHWIDDAGFAELIAVAQAAPGPNVIIVSLIGWHVAGPAGLAVATLAMIAPSSSLAFLAGRSILRYGQNDFVSLAKRALAPIAVGLIAASGAVMAQVADHGFLTLGVTLAMTLLVFFTRLNPLWGIAGGAALGLIAGRLGVLS
ncbi:MAG: chromate transporter [Beijerinckiaceae bacterium]